MTVESNALQVGQQILLGRGLRALVSNLPRQLIQLCPRLRNLLGRIDHVHRRLQGSPAARKIRHLHHDEAHVLGQTDHVIALVVPLGDLFVELLPLRLEFLHLFGDFDLLLLGEDLHSLAGVRDALDLGIFVDHGAVRYECRRAAAADTADFALLLVPFGFAVEFTLLSEQKNILREKFVQWYKKLN